MLSMCTIFWYSYPMHVSTRNVKSLCRKQGLNLNQVLDETGVSRNAYYTIARKACVLPKSIVAIADRLGVSPLDILEDPGSPNQRATRLIGEVNKVKSHYPEVDEENVRHTLLLLREKPIDRLRRALTHAQKPDIH